MNTTTKRLIKNSADELRKAQMFRAILDKALLYAPMDAYKEEIRDIMGDMKGYCDARILSMYHNGADAQHRDFAVTIEEVSGSPPDYKRAFEKLMEYWNNLPDEEKPEIHAELNRLGL